MLLLLLLLTQRCDGHVVVIDVTHKVKAVIVNATGEVVAIVVVDMTWGGHCHCWYNVVVVDAKWGAWH